MLRNRADALVVAGGDPDAFWCGALPPPRRPGVRGELGKQARQIFPAGTTGEAGLRQIERVHAGLRERGGHPERPGS